MGRNFKTFTSVDENNLSYAVKQWGSLSGRYSCMKIFSHPDVVSRAGTQLHQLKLGQNRVTLDNLQGRVLAAGCAMLYSGDYHQLIPCLQPDFCLAVHKNSFGALFASRSLLSCLYHPTSYPDFPRPPPESSLASICETVSETHKIQLGSHSVGWLPCLHCKVALVLGQDPPSLFPKPQDSYPTFPPTQIYTLPPTQIYTLTPDQQTHTVHYCSAICTWLHFT